MTAHLSRRLGLPIKVYCLPHERELILSKARAAGHSASRYLLLVGQGYPVRSILDFEHVAELARVNADQARLGNLLKLMLTEAERLPGLAQIQASATLLTLVEEIRATQQTLRHTMKAIVEPLAARRAQP